MVLNSQSDQKPKRTPEDEDHKIQEAITRSLKEREPADSAPEQTHLYESCVGGDQLRCSVDLAKNNTYRLVGVVSHLGGTTHSGHYVSDVYSVERDKWLHYNDHRVNRVDEADVLTRAPLGYFYNAPHWGGLFRAPPLISETTGPILKIQTASESPGKTVEGKQILLTSGSRVTSQVRSKSKCSTFRAW